MDDLLFKTLGKKYVLTDFGLRVLKQDYALGYSQMKIAKKFNVSEDTIRNWMKENSIPTRKRKYSINENYFDIIDTPEKAYWLGFLSADGYIHEERGEIQLELQESDKNHIEKFMRSIESNKPIMEIRCGENNKYLHYRFTIKCRKMVETLKKYNIKQNKSLVFYPKNIPEALFGYWVLGYMDGDGSIYKVKNKFKISFTGTLKTLKIIKKYFNSTNQIRKEHRCDNTFNFTLEVQKCQEFLENIKYNELSFILERKK